MIMCLGQNVILATLSHTVKQAYNTLESSQKPCFDYFSFISYACSYLRQAWVYNKKPPASVEYG